MGKIEFEPYNSNPFTIIIIIIITITNFVGIHIDVITTNIINIIINTNTNK